MKNYKIKFMKTINITVCLAFISLFFACQNSTEEQQLSEKEKELLERENELLKKELEKTDTISDQTKMETSAFLVDQSVVKKTFLEYLPNISGGRKLSYSVIKIGDLNGDGLIDGVVDYGLEPTWEDNGGGGNAISEFPGIIAFVNSGQALTVADHTEELEGVFGSRNELIKISNGVIFLEVYEHTYDDARCCPSLMTLTKLVLRNNKITKLK
jgi:hypothetical protein